MCWKSESFQSSFLPASNFHSLKPSVSSHRELTDPWIDYTPSFGSGDFWRESSVPSHLSPPKNYPFPSSSLYLDPYSRFHSVIRFSRFLLPAWLPVDPIWPLPSQAIFTYSSLISRPPTTMLLEKPSVLLCNLQSQSYPSTFLLEGFSFLRCPFNEFDLWRWKW